MRGLDPQQDRGAEDEGQEDAGRRHAQPGFAGCRLDLRAVVTFPAMPRLAPRLPAVALLAVLFSGACAATVPTPRSRAGDEAVREQDVADARLAAEVRMALLEKLGEDVLGVTVDAAGGRVRLIGAVDQRSTQELAEEVAKSVPGVQRVDNRLFARQESPESTTVGRAAGTAGREVEDALLEMRVGRNLLAEIGRYALDLEVEVTEGVVSLRGTLPDEERKSLALRAARETAGVQRVVDLTTVR
jgi:osmotically-inducible protein OsmY